MRCAGLILNRTSKKNPQKRGAHMQRRSSSRSRRNLNFTGSFVFCAPVFCESKAEQSGQQKI